MGKSLESELSDPGKLLLKLIKFIDGIVPEIAVKVDPNYPNMTETERKATEAKTREIVNAVMLKMMP